MLVVGTAIAIGAIAVDRHKRKKKLRNMSVKEREEFERYERVQQQQQQQQQISQQYPSSRQLRKQRRCQETGYHSQPRRSDKSSRMNYNRGGSAASRLDQRIEVSQQPPPTPQRNKENPRVQQHVQSMVGDNDVYDPPPKYTP